MTGPAIAGSPIQLACSAELFYLVSAAVACELLCSNHCCFERPVRSACPIGMEEHFKFHGVHRLQAV